MLKKITRKARSMFDLNKKKYDKNTINNRIIIKDLRSLN